MVHHMIFFIWLLLAATVLEAQNAPVTTVASLYGNSNGPVTVPVKVTGFTSIASFSLDLEYDPTVLTYVQVAKNPLLTGSFLVGDHSLSNGKRHLILSWFGNPVSLTDGSSLAELKFNYISGTSALNWLDDGISCEYADANYNPLNDSPQACYYLNGSVTSEKLVKIGLFLEGLYDAASHKMIGLSGSSAIPCAEPVADQFSVELHNSTLYSTIEYLAPDLSLDVGGWAQFTVPAGKNGTYYITIRHRNSVATVSAVPVSFVGNTIEYNFRDASTKALGNNMKLMNDGFWAIYTGDVNQDNFVNLTDLTQAGNEASDFSAGYLSSDCNGDGLIDATDLILIDNNSSEFIHSVIP